MTMSDLIAKAIREMLAESGSASIRRNEMAEKMGCAPSQINYVITSRFTPEQGYIVESQRGGGGFIRISRVVPTRQLARMHTVNMIGERIDFRSARIILQNLVNDDYLDRQSATLMLTALTDTSLKEAPSIQRARIRADILKQMLLFTLK